MRKLTWREIEVACDNVGNKILNSEFAPEYLVGIAMGGLIPLTLLAKQLKITNVVTLTTSSYENQKKKQLKISYLPEIDLENKKVLLVDEIVDTGETLKTVVNVMREHYKVGELKTVSLAVHTEHCKFYPDFWDIDTSEWIAFPWDKHKSPDLFK